ncbi:MAG: hypothetical protein Q8N89_11615 [Azonexus sp.]|nr:hypothetical protein [Azonexus sp.]
MKAPDLSSWLGANHSNSFCYCEDEQQRQGHKDKLSWIGQLRSRPQGTGQGGFRDVTIRYILPIVAQECFANITINKKTCACENSNSARNREEINLG